MLGDWEWLLQFHVGDKVCRDRSAKGKDGSHHNNRHLEEVDDNKDNDGNDDDYNENEDKDDDIGEYFEDFADRAAGPSHDAAHAEGQNELCKEDHARDYGDVRADTPHLQGGGDGGRELFESHCKNVN